MPKWVTKKQTGGYVPVAANFGGEDAQPKWWNKSIDLKFFSAPLWVLLAVVAAVLLLVWAITMTTLFAKEVSGMEGEYELEDPEGYLIDGQISTGVPDPTETFGVQDYDNYKKMSREYLKEMDYTEVEGMADPSATAVQDLLYS